MKLASWNKCITEQISQSENLNDAQREKKSLELSISQKSRQSKNSMYVEFLLLLGIRTETVSISISYLLYKCFSTVFLLYNCRDSSDDCELNKKMNILMDQLKIPIHARQKMLNLPRSQKLKMTKMYRLKVQTKKKASGKKWSQKFAANSDVGIETLQHFCVVLRDEEDGFVKDFMNELGLDHLCRLGGSQNKGYYHEQHKSNLAFNMELLRVMKAIIDTNEASLKTVVAHDLAIRIITEKVLYFLLLFLLLCQHF